MDIDQKVRYYKRLYDHPSGLSLCDLYDIARDLDVTFFKGDFAEMKGAYYYIERTKFIVLDYNLSSIEERFVLAHELGHAIFHRTESCFFNRRYAQAMKPRMELEADEFSAKSLLPKIIPIEDRRYYTLEQLAIKYCVPVELMRIKLKLPK